MAHRDRAGLIRPALLGAGLLTALLIGGGTASATSLRGAFAGLDGVQLGMAPSEIPSSLGPFTREAGGRRLYRRRQLTVTFLAGRVARIVSVRADQRLAGFGVGTPLAALEGGVRGLSCASAQTVVCSLSSANLGRRTAIRFLAAAGRVDALDLEQLTTALAPVLPAGRVVTVGYSVDGRPIRAHRMGDPGSARKALIVGAIHGDEPESARMARLIRSLRVADADVWVIDTLNPDGLAAGTRQNADRVDLNRNFAAGWRLDGSLGYRYYSGPRPFSEPESRVARDLTDLLRPALSIWYHQPYGYVITPIGGDLRLAYRYGRLAHYPVHTPGPPRSTGQGPTWQNAAFPGTTAFIVELPAKPLPLTALRLHARAALTLATARPVTRSTP